MLVFSVSDWSTFSSSAYGRMSREDGEVRKARPAFRQATARKNRTDASCAKRRMEELTYPDGEKVVYEYDDAGQVTAVKGTHNSEGSYVEKIGYDEFGQRIYIKYGNGIETNYDYKKETRLLDAIETQNKYGKHYQNIKYSFDKVGNISRYTNDCMESGAGGNYITTQKYSYDNLYQLIGVAGETE